MGIILMTTNCRKVSEYRRFFNRHDQDVSVEQPTESPETLTLWLQNAKAVLTDENNVFDIKGNSVDPNYIGPARNICRLCVWVLENNVLTKKLFIREVDGFFDGNKLKPDDPTVFDWDSAFSLNIGVTLHAMVSVGLKNSAREQCLSEFTRIFLARKTLKKLYWTFVDPKSIVDWNNDARVLLKNPFCEHLSNEIQNALHFVVNQGIFFRAATNRRIGNYWFPGLNGGVPYVPKDDPFHEVTFMVHDFMHQLIPDPIYDGVDTVDHRRVYIAYRMMSEAMSLVLADMVFVRDIAGQKIVHNYDLSTRRIFPLYQALDTTKRNDLRWLLWQMTQFVLLGNHGTFPVHSMAWKNFEEKYSRFFVADFQWTRINWQGLVGRTETMRRWISLLGSTTFHSQRLSFVSDIVDEIGRDLPVPALVEKVFDFILQKQILPAFAYRLPADISLSKSNGFRRWLTGQCALFARYANIIPIPTFAQDFAARIRDSQHFSKMEMKNMRTQFEKHVRFMAKENVISRDDATIFSSIFPLFTPFFLKDYDRAKQEFKTVKEASRVAFR